MSTTNRLARLSEAGVSIWLDDLSRERLNSGNLAELIRDRYVVGVTTNPTIFASAVSAGHAYDEQVRELAARGADVHAAVRELTTADVRNAADVFRDVYARTNGVDGRVSIEVDPGLAKDTERTVAEAQDLWKAVDRPNIFVKIPATEEGLPAITRTLAEGISVNVTLIFSVERYRAVIDAFFAGLERARANGHDLRTIQSVASFFVSRVDSEVDKRLEAIGTDEALALRGEAAIANARLAYAAYQELFDTDRWRALADDGAHPQRPLWASTGVKNPEYSDTRYVDQLVVAGTVNTMPEKTLHAAADHAEIGGDTVTGTADRAQAVFDRLAAVGVDIPDVFVTLENEGVEKFDKSWTELLDTVSGQLAQAGS
ncbi:transaldolase [Amycolatopsis arida]|uniref:Transaldolase n=1 Tax=Amycolatopsis arida TaxID=587909 RepID=A0A1I5Z1A8_9PSEU|nr:transaldolase [Amycolatopsis arida]TDX90042.1 transaldolase [Amycolatopsis arida]SFQ50294.1 transaldolase [Amycolatopsis arida]